MYLNLVVEEYEESDMELNLWEYFWNIGKKIVALYI